MTEPDEIKWSSHMGALMACIGATKGAVIELGVGHFSTPALHAICVASGRGLTSVEKDSEWISKFSTKFSNNLHHFILDDYESAIIGREQDRYSVAFIDHSPGGESRAKLFQLLLPVSEFVLVHDYHDDTLEAIEPILIALGDKVKFHVCNSYFPPTLVASLIREIPEVMARL